MTKRPLPMSRRLLSSLFIALGLFLLVSGGVLWAQQTVWPAWRFAQLDTDGDGIVLVETLAGYPTATPFRAPENTEGIDLLLPEFPEPEHPSTKTLASPTPSPRTDEIVAVPPEKPPRSVAPRPNMPERPPPARNIPTRIVVPRVDLDAPVVEMGWVIKTTEDGRRYSEWLVPDFAAGWHKNSALPGHGGNTVLSGHNNIAGEVFRTLEFTEPGDEVILYVGEQAYTYIITEKYILLEKGASYEQRLRNAQFLQPTEDERLTLITCWPYETNTHRLIVIARPTWYTPPTIP